MLQSTVDAWFLVVPYISIYISIYSESWYEPAPQPLLKVRNVGGVPWADASECPVKSKVESRVDRKVLFSLFCFSLNYLAGAGTTWESR